jgi:hypothetical protein
MKSLNPFADTPETDADDLALVSRIREGDRDALSLASQASEMTSLRELRSGLPSISGRGCRWRTSRIGCR